MPLNEYNKPNIVIIGASGHAKVVIDIIERLDEFFIIGLIDSYKPKDSFVFDYRILGKEDDIPVLSEIYNFNTGIIAIGDNWTRKLIYGRINEVSPNFKFISAIHPHAIIGKNVIIGKGTMIMAGAIVNSDAKVDDFCIINTKASLGHESVLEKFSSLAPNSTIGGNVKIGAYTAICLSASVIQDVKIGKHSIIGASSLVNKNVEDYKMVYGIPAKVIKSIKQGEKYLYHIGDYTKEKKPIKQSNGLEIITEKKNWDNVLNALGSYDFYHTYNYHMLSKIENKTPILLKYVENDVLIAIPLLVREIPNTKYLDATSVYGYAGPISKGITESFDNTNFKQALTEYFKKNNYVSVFSRLNPFIEHQCDVLNNIGSVKQQGKIVNIDLNLDLNTQRSRFRDRLKTHINKSRRLCTIREAKTKEDMQSYIDIYHENMDRVKAKNLYYFSESYFQNLLKNDSFKTTVLLAIDNESGKIIAGSMFISTNGIVQYYLSGTKNEFLHLTPTKLLIDEMRIKATNKGCKFFNLGGGIGGSDDDSLFDFKASFSKDFKEFKLWKYIVNQEVYDELVTKKGIQEESDFFPLYRALDDITISQ